MAAEDFFARWSKKKTDASTTVDVADASTEISAHPLNEARAENLVKANPDAAVKPVPTQEDVDQLTHDSDYSVFMSQGVDESVKRSAMKKLFTDPHFNIMDGLDIYIDDYNKFEPISPALLASLNHAKALLDPLSQLKTPLMRLLEKIPKEPEQGALESFSAADGEPTSLQDIAITEDEQKEGYAEPQESHKDGNLKGASEKEPEIRKADAMRNVDDV